MSCTNKSVVLIPYWVEEALKRNQLPLAKALDFSVMKNILSSNDLVLFVTAQSMLPKMIDCCALQMGWQITDAESKALYNQVMQLSNDPSFKTEYENRYIHLNGDAQYEKPFITYDLSLEVSGLVLYPTFYQEGSLTPVPQHHFDAVEAVLKTLYVYNTYDEVAKTPLFQHYLELLS